MRRFILTILLIAMAMSAFTSSSVLAESIAMTVSPISSEGPGEVDKQEQDMNEQAHMAEDVVEEKASIVAPENVPKTRKAGWAFLDEEELFYTCPVRKTDVYVKWERSYGPLKIDVRIEKLVDGSWCDAGSYTINEFTATVLFQLDEPARYRLFVKNLDGKDGRCDFCITGVASSDS